MTDNVVEVFKGRDARQDSRARHPASGSAIAAADLEGQFRIATAIANATEAVPRGYRKQPGAVLLALAWSQGHDIDILTTIQNVAFVDGRAVVDATMQRALAKRAGYELTISVGPDSATVGVKAGGNGKWLGEATYSMDDAKQAGLAGKRNWQQNPEDMLVARATTRAVRRFAPDVLLGLLVSDEVDDPPDVTEVLASPDEVPDTPPRRPLQDDGGDDRMGDQGPMPEPAPVVGIPDADEADDAAPTATATTVGAAESATWWESAAAMRADLKARDIRTPEVVREAQEIAKRLEVATPAGTLDAIHKHPDEGFRTAFRAWVANHDPRYDEEPF